MTDDYHLHSFPLSFIKFFWQKLAKNVQYDKVTDINENPDVKPTTSGNLGSTSWSFFWVMNFPIIKLVPQCIYSFHPSLDSYLYITDIIECFGY